MAASDSDSRITMGELGRLVKEVRDEQRDFRTEVTGRFASLDGTFVRLDVFNLTAAAAADRISKLESNQAWLVRIIVSTVVVAIIGGLFAASNTGALG